MECDICVERPLCHAPCATCGLRTCRRCARRIVTEHTECAVCTGCGRGWDAEESVARLGRTFWTTEYRAVRRERLFRDEQLLLPGTVEHARRVQLDRALTEGVRALQTRVRNGEWEQVPNLRTARLMLYHHRNGGGAPVDARRAQWVVRHCGHDGCSAGLLDGDGRCTTCARPTCLACGEASTGGDHVCAASTLETMRAIASSCRPCVRCNAPCARVEGCATMWCVRCHTFWNWETGRVIDASRGHAPHNPDHRRWVSTAQLREVDDIPCGGIPDGGMLHTTTILHMFDYVSSSAPVILEAAECVYRAQRLRARYPRTWDPMTVNLDSRVALLNGDLTEEAFKRVIERNERACQYKQRVGEVLETFVMAASDVLQRFCNRDEGVDITALHLVELRGLVDVALVRVSEAYGRAVPRVDALWRWTLPNARGPRAPAILEPE